MQLYRRHVMSVGAATLLSAGASFLTRDTQHSDPATFTFRKPTAGAGGGGER